MERTATDNNVEHILHGSARRMARRDGSAPLKKLGLVVLMLILWPSSSEAQNPTGACPLNFTVLNQFPYVADTVKTSSNNLEGLCSTIDSGLKMVLSGYLRESGFFLVPRGSSQSCVDAYQSQLQSQGVSGVNISSNCPSNALLSERGTDVCDNVQSVQNFTSLVPADQLNDLNSSCSQSLGSTAACGICHRASTLVQATVNEVRGSNNSSCSDFVTLYTVGIVNGPGPLDQGTASCILFILSGQHGGKNKNLKFIGVGVGGMLFVCLIGALIYYIRYRREQAANLEARKKRDKDLLSASSVPASSIHWFDIDEVNRATGNFSRGSILGTGGYGNVYRGTLPDGSVVAVKRFKNCAPAGDADFVHEVEMISSVRHRYLVGIRGCCVASSGLTDGHQRMIVYDYMPNGSLHDHLFPAKPGRMTLDWPTRRKIAIGTARGLEYLHHDALPAIFHRDIKSSNILLDTDFEARLADFGLAKFTPEGVSHLTTRVAGTFGYVAPEYALYGQLTDRSDVYSFGMVILELVTGRKALSSPSDDSPRALLSDWAWPLVRQGRWKSLVDPRLGDDVGSCEAMERFILVGLLCAHPQVFYRPSIDQALKMLESNVSDLPTVPDRPLPLNSNQADIDEALLQESLMHNNHSSRAGFSWYSRSVSNASSDAATSVFSTLHERKHSQDSTHDPHHESSSLHDKKSLPKTRHTILIT